ncbi:MAG: tetratricopeptide repeat protein [Candidatus Sumerlaeaceae bacterium]|nr:tetratricopeptide repeat protein [Candidatus Sumerlaeaceae bacterium]
MAQLSISQNPCNGYAYYYLGYVELMQDRHDEAIRNFKTGEPYMPHLTQLLKMLAQAYYFAGSFETAVKAFDRYLSMEPTPRVGADNIFRLWAQSLCRTQEFGRAAVALAKADSYETYRSELLQSRILNAILLNQVTMADYYYRVFKTCFPKKALEPSSLFSGALAAQKMEALIRFLELNRLRGEIDPTSEKILAMGYAKQGRLHEAVAVLSTASRISPNDSEIPLFLGDAYFQLGEIDKACEQYRRHLRLFPESPFRKELFRRCPDLAKAEELVMKSDAKESGTSVPAQLP